jgi:hypothetical protein
LIIDFAIIPRAIIIDDDSRSASATDALAQGISLSKLILNASGAVPVPYVKGAAAVILALLEPIQVRLPFVLKNYNLIANLLSNYKRTKTTIKSLLSI